MTAIVALLVLAQTPGAGPRERRPSGQAEFRVRDEVSLRAALGRAGSGDVNILVEGLIEVRRGIYVPAERSIVRILGVAPSAGLRFDLTQGKAGPQAGPDEHGLALHCRQAILADLEISGYEQGGSAIKGHAAELFSVSNCRFRDIGTQTRPFKATPARSAADTGYTLCIGSHDMDSGHFEVLDCRFERCAFNTWQWSHCIYASGRSMTVAGNTFVETGNPLCLGGSKWPGTIQVLRNSFENPRGGPDSFGRLRLAFVGVLTPNDSVVFAGNRVSGMWDSGWTGSPSPGRHLIDHNDYSGMEFYGSWAADTGRGRSLSWKDWRDAGFDANSKPPRQSPVPEALKRQAGGARP